MLVQMCGQEERTLGVLSEALTHQTDSLNPSGLGRELSK